MLFEYRFKSLKLSLKEAVLFFILSLIILVAALPAIVLWFVFCTVILIAMIIDNLYCRWLDRNK